jgi:peptidase E
MITTFLLHGGRLKLKDKRNDDYFRELTKDLVDGDQVLFVGFARRDETDRNEVYEREKQFILAQAVSDIQVVNATYDSFIEQVKAARVVHLTGGQAPELINDIQKYPDFIDAIKGKVVGGSSAGACLFSTYYFYDDASGVLEGLGTLPIRLRVHSDNPEFGNIEKSIVLLEKYPKDLELLLIEECAWVAKQADDI